LSIKTYCYNPKTERTHPRPSQEGNPTRQAVTKAAARAIPLLRGVEGCVIPPWRQQSVQGDGQTRAARSLLFFEAPLQSRRYRFNPINMLEIVKTADGSNTIFNAEVGEHYHSTHGALQESRHVFIQSGLAYFLENNPSANSVSILEVGFGTGLNFLLSADYCTDSKISLDYVGIEAYPLSPGMIRTTGYDQYLSAETWKMFNEKYGQALHSTTEFNPHCKLQIANCKLLDFRSNRQFDLIYFDAFASARQPEMWEEAAIGHTIQFLKSGGVFVTYAITGNLKRALKVLGCRVEKAPGAAGKREMLRAVKIV